MSLLAVKQYRQTNLVPLTDKQVRDAQRDKVYIFNVSPYAHNAFVERTYTIPARGEGQEVSEPLAIDGVVYTTIYKGGELQWIGRDGIEVAQEIVGTFRMLNPSQDLTPFGVFLSMSPVPSQGEIDKARGFWFEKCNQRVNEGDQLFAVNGGVENVKGAAVSNIGKDHRIALKELGLKRAWSGVNIRMVECEECGTSNMPNAAKCKECSAIFNEELARQRYPQMFAQERGKPGPKPKEVAA